MMGAIDRYEELIAASPAAKEMFAACQEESGQGFPFRVMLNVPMQRILKYSLLLREIQRGTVKAANTHKDSEGLDHALKAQCSSLHICLHSKMLFELAPVDVKPACMRPNCICLWGASPFSHHCFSIQWHLNIVNAFSSLATPANEAIQLLTMNSATNHASHLCRRLAP
jgi:hypothetical protein